MYEQHSSSRIAKARKSHSQIPYAHSDNALKVDWTGMIIGWNSYCAELIGYSAEEVVGRPFSSLLPAEDRVEAELLLRAASKLESDVNENWILQAGGSRLWCLLEIEPETSEDALLISITDQREQLLAKERFFCWRDRNAEFYRQAVITLAPTGAITSWDNRAMELFGYSSNEILGRKLLDLCPPHCSLDIEAQDDFAPALKHGIVEYILPCMTKGGEIVSSFFRIRVLRNSRSGRLAGFYAVVTLLTQSHGLI